MVEWYKERVYYERGNNFLKNTSANYCFDVVENYILSHFEIISWPDNIKKEIFKNLYDNNLEKFLKRFEK